MLNPSSSWLNQLLLFSSYSFSSSPLFAEGRCPGSKAAFFNQTNSFASTPTIKLNDQSFTIACWIKQTTWVPNKVAAIYGDWYYPWQFLLSIENQKIKFDRHQRGPDEWFYLKSTVAISNTWTHVAVTVDDVRKAVYIYVDGKEVGYRSYKPEAKSYGPTGKLYQIGDDGHWNDHQFHGSIMDLYVFGMALTLDQINRLRGELCVTTHSIRYCKPSPNSSCQSGELGLHNHCSGTFVLHCSTHPALGLPLCSRPLPFYCTSPHCFWPTSLSLLPMGARGGPCR